MRITRAFNLILGILIIFVGVLPLLKSADAVPTFLTFIPTVGPIYQGIIVVLGILILINTRKDRGVRLIR